MKAIQVDYYTHTQVDLATDALDSLKLYLLAHVVKMYIRVLFASSLL